MGQRYGAERYENGEREIVEEKYITWLERRMQDYLIRDELQRGRAERKAEDLKRLEEGRSS